MPLVLWMGCLIAAAGPPGPTPLRWSPDGRWLAFVEEVRPVEPRAGSSWLFDREWARTEPPAAAVTSYRLWAYSPQDGESILLDESRGPISAPSWNRDGTKMSFGRLIREPDVSARWEVVIQDAPRHKRVIFREPIGSAPPPAEDFPDVEFAWSPDGRMIIVPSFQRPGLNLIRADNGQVVRNLEGASHPSWSHEDAKLAFFRGKLGNELFIVDAPSLEPRRLAEVPPDSDGLPGPFWSRDGQFLSFLRRGGSSPQSGWVETLKLLRVRTDTGRTDTVIDLVHDPIAKDGELLGAWYAPDPEGEGVFYATLSSGQKTAQLSWPQSRPNEIQKRLNPLDGSAALGALASAPGGRSLALRFRLGARWSPPAVCDPATEELVCVAPDEETRKRWSRLIFNLMREALTDGVASASLADGTPVARPSVLPVPGELEPGNPTSLKLRRLSRIGLRLAESRVSTEAIEDRLALAYFAEEYTSALAAVEELTARAEDSGRRRDLLGLRAQILLASRDLETAAPLIEHLRRTEPKPAFEVEPDLPRPRLVPISDPRSSWPALLGQVLEKLLQPPADSVFENEQDQVPVEREFRPPARDMPGQRVAPAVQRF